MVLRFLLVLFISFLLLISQAQSDELSSETGAKKERTKETGIEVAGFDIKEIKNHLIVVLIILSVVFVKMLYAYVEILSAYIPESCFLILIGIITGAILKFGFSIKAHSDVWELTPSLFLYVLLPPIVFEASTHLCCREFLDVFFPVLFYAIIGTVVNFLLIGVLLYYTAFGGAMGPKTPNVTQSDCFLFSSVIVAVDPVAVLGIFNDIHVNKILYFYVFGESLFNDAITIVLYNVMEAFMFIDSPGVKDILLGIVSFFTISFGGALIGIVFGVISALVTRLTHKCHGIEPMVILAFGYLSYLIGDMVKWSGIISMICCAMIQATYAFRNMSAKSVMVIRKCLKLLATFFEAIIFIDLGIALMRTDHSWHTGFCLWALVYTVTVRFVATFIQSIILNKTGLLLQKISRTEQFIMGYGGLRGAVAFTLVKLISAKVLAKSAVTKELYVTTTLTIIVFTILFMGLTIKPLVKLFHVKLEKEEGLSIFTELGQNVVDHISSGIEAIEGHLGRNSFRELAERFDIRIIRRLLQNDPETYDEKILKIYEKVALMIHYATIKPTAESSRYLEKLSPSKLRTKLATNNSDPNIERSTGSMPGVQTVLEMTGDFVHSNSDIRQHEPSSIHEIPSKSDDERDLSMLMRKRRGVAKSHRGFVDFQDIFRKTLAHRTHAIRPHRSRHKYSIETNETETLPTVPQVTFNLEEMDEDAKAETTKM